MKQETYKKFSDKITKAKATNNNFLLSKPTKICIKNSLKILDIFKEFNFLNIDPIFTIDGEIVFIFDINSIKNMLTIHDNGDCILVLNTTKTNEYYMIVDYIRPSSTKQLLYSNLKTKLNEYAEV